MNKEWNAVTLLRYARHDWLNKLQLVKGNLSLNYIDRANEIIDEIINEAKHEAKLSNLHLSKTTELLLTFNWSNNKFQLETEVIGEERNLSYYDEALNQWTESFLSYLNQSINETDNHHLMITFQLYSEKVKVSFDFNGKSEKDENMKHFLKEKSTLHNSISIIESYIGAEELFLAIELQ
jgi:stage 0 sporulation protein B (sporulation initiation phosphotransferase)